jgi:hypothetical protein
MIVAPVRPAKSTRRPVNEATATEVSPPMISRIIPIRSSTEKSGVFWSCSRIATMTRSASRRARARMSRCPFVRGSKEPG